MLRIAIVQPSSPPKEELLERGLEVLRELGIFFKSFADPSPTIPSISAFLLTEILALGKFDYLWAVRGGYGAIKILPFLDEFLSKIKIEKLPKIPPLIGFSDITALHCYFWKRFGSLGIHAPMVVNLPEVEKDCLNLLISLLEGKIKELIYEGKSFKDGEAFGYLFGGNLTTFASLCGTPYLPIKEDIILFFEDVNEAPYRLERALMQVILNISPEAIKGLVLGCLDGVSAENLLNSLKYNLPENIPIGVDFPFGHGKKNYPLLFGAKARLYCYEGRAILNLNANLNGVVG